jgi:hypothetical protein
MGGVVASRPIVVALVVCGAVMGCGGGESTSSAGPGPGGDAVGSSGRVDAREDRQSIEGVYKRFLRAQANGSPKALCAVLTTHSKELLLDEGSGDREAACLRFYVSVMNRDPGQPEVTIPEPRILRVEVKGDRAVMRVKRPGNITFTRVRFIRENGAWRTDGDIDMGPL